MRLLKAKLTNKPLIAYAQNDLPFYVYCDASAGTIEKNGNKISGGLGVVLTQPWNDGKERVIGYVSRKLHKHEENYSAFLLELLAMTFAVTHFLHYLYGQRKFKIFSDHKPLSKLNKENKKTKHRLEDVLLDYTFDVIYRKGSDQEAADFLSRNALAPVNKETSMDLQEHSKTEIRRFQREDPICRLIYKIKKYDSEQVVDENQVSQYRIIKKNLDNLIIDDDSIIYLTTEERQLLVLPKEFIQRTISVSHNSFVGGHRDSLKTMERIQKVYWWPGLPSDVDEYIRRCEVCQRVKNPKNRSTPCYPLQPHKISERFNEQVHADLMGPLKSNTENKYIQVMSDSFTKWIEIAAIPDKSAETVSNAIYEKWICRNSVMTTLVTDNGKEFANHLMEELCQRLKINHRKTSPYHAQTNAQCERQNRTIISYLKSFLEDKTLDWEKLLLPCQFSYNTQIHSSTKYSPYFLRHMIDPTVPFRELKPERHNYHESWTNEALLRLQVAWATTYKNLSKAKESQE